jgi:hypothetical protein
MFSQFSQNILFSVLSAIIGFIIGWFLNSFINSGRLANSEIVPIDYKFNEPKDAESSVKSLPEKEQIEINKFEGLETELKIRDEEISFLKHSSKNKLSANLTQEEIHLSEQSEQNEIWRSKIAERDEIITRLKSRLKEIETKSQQSSQSTNFP